MKLKKLKMKNFAKFTNFEVEFDGKITNLVGINGSGKTTVGLTAIWACLKGISKNNTNNQLIGERWRFIGKDKATADIELTLIDEEKNAEIKVTNNISKDSNNINFHAPKNYKMDRDWLHNLFSVAFLSAKNFTQRSPKEQALLLGIDTASFDDELKKIKEDYTYVNRQIRSSGDIQQIEKVEKVSIGDLLTEKESAEKFNKQQDETEDKLYDCQNSINIESKRIKELLEEIKILKESIASANDFLIRTESPKEKIDVQPIVDKINNAEEINQKAVLYDKYLEKKAFVDVACKKLDENKQLQEKVIQERLNYIKSFNFDFNDLSIGEDGGLLLNNKPIKEPYFSKGELELIVAKLHASKNPELKFRFIDDFELLDEQNQENIIKDLLNNGFQIITAQVGDSKNSQENTILLRECKKANV